MSRRLSRTLGALGALVPLLVGCMGAIEESTTEVMTGPRPPVVGANPAPSTMPPSTSTPPPAAPSDAPRLFRLSHTQWENAVKDLLRLDKATGLSSSFIRDPISGFENSGEILEVTVELRGDYERAAEALADQVANDPARLAKLLPPGAPSEANARAEALVRDLGRRAYRRPLEAEEVAELTALFKLGPQATALTDPFAAGAALVVRALLQSPFFLYRPELGTKRSGARVALTDHEVAAKLAFALSNTMPDDTLFAAADRGGLNSREAVQKEAIRLLSSPSALSVVDNFHLQLFQVPKYAGITGKDSKLFPGWDAIKSGVPRDAETETLMFGREIFQKDLGLRELFTAPFSFVNARLATLYGLPGTFANDSFVRAELNPSERAGVLTHIGFLATRAGATQPDPVHRGLFVIEKVLCGTVPPPIPDVTPPPATAGKTNRQLWETQTHQGACRGCHAELINPVGFAFEGYDAIGRVRREDAGQPVDTSGFYRFPSSGEKRFTGVVEMARVMVETPEVQACLARHWLAYLYGRSPQPSDEAEVARLAGRLGKDRASIRALLLDIVTSESFLTRSL